MYKLFNVNNGMQSLNRHDADGSVTSIPFNPENVDYQEYLAWLAEGNTPQPADEPEE